MGNFRLLKVSGLVAAVLAAAAWVDVAPVGAETSAQATGVDKTAEIRGLRLADDDVLSIALHPASDIEISARNLDLDVCPATWEGQVATAGNTSWPRATGFTECRPLAGGSVRLPSPAGGSFHLVLAVRAHGTAPTGPGSLLIRYGASDGFFVVGPPTLAPGERGPGVRVIPTTRFVAAMLTSYTVAADDETVHLDDVRLRVRQGAASIRETTGTTMPARGATYGPVDAGRAVTLRTQNRGREPIRAAIEVTWE